MEKGKTIKFLNLKKHLKYEVFISIENCCKKIILHQLRNKNLMDQNEEFQSFYNNSSFHSIKHNKSKEKYYFR